MEQMVLENVLTQIRQALELNDLTTASSIIETLRPADQAELFWDLDETEQATLLPQINPADAADIFEELYDEDVAEIAVQLPLTTLIRIVNEMEPDEAADLLDDLAKQARNESERQQWTKQLVDGLTAAVAMSATWISDTNPLPSPGNFSVPSRA